MFLKKAFVSLQLVNGRTEEKADLEANNDLGNGSGFGAMIFRKLAFNKATSEWGIMLCVLFCWSSQCIFWRYYSSESHSAECHSAKCHSAECHSAKCHFSKCHSGECHSAECHSAKCHSAECHPADCIMLYAVQPNVIMLCVVLLNGIMLSVVLQNITVPTATKRVRNWYYGCLTDLIILLFWIIEISNKPFYLLNEGGR